MQITVIKEQAEPGVYRYRGRLAFEAYTCIPERDFRNSRIDVEQYVLEKIKDNIVSSFLRTADHRVVWKLRQNLLNILPPVILNDINEAFEEFESTIKQLPEPEITIVGQENTGLGSLTDEEFATLYAQVQSERERRVARRLQR
jgi:hypothetical protein